MQHGLIDFGPVGNLLHTSPVISLLYKNLLGSLNNFIFRSHYPNSLTRCFNQMVNFLTNVNDDLKKATNDTISAVLNFISKG
jgi:hypothetical protein